MLEGRYVITLMAWKSLPLLVLLLLNLKKKIK